MALILQERNALPTITFERDEFMKFLGTLTLMLDIDTLTQLTIDLIGAETDPCDCKSAPKNKSETQAGENVEP